MTSEELEKRFSQLSNKADKIEENNDYFNGKNPYILNKPHTKKPDNRMPVTMAKMAVDSMAGYAGKSGNIKVLYDNLTTEDMDEDDPFIEYMSMMDDYNDSDTEISELYEEVLKQGEAYEIFWTSDELGLPGGLLTTEYKIVPSDEIVVVWDRSLKSKMLYAIHYTTGEDKRRFATVYYPGYTEEWEATSSITQWVLTDTYDNYFSSVPVNIYRCNRHSKALFDAEKTYIDGIDEIYSKSMNEVDRFNAAIALFGNTLGQKFVKDFIEGNVAVLDNIGDDENTFRPGYLEKNLSGVKEFYESLMDRMETWFRKSIGIADFSDDAFAGQQSGIAIMFKLIPMEFRAAQIETYFNAGLMKRLEYYADIYNLSSSQIDVGEYTVSVKSKRNIPVDVEAKVRVATMLSGIVSEETLLSYLPKEIVGDVKKEMKRLGSAVEDLPFAGGDVGGGLQAGEAAVEAVKLSGIQIQAANDIIKLVGLPLDQGGITREAAINQLMIFLGLTREQAEKIVGAKKTSQGAE